MLSAPRFIVPLSRHLLHPVAITTTTAVKSKSPLYIQTLKAPVARMASQAQPAHTGASMSSVGIKNENINQAEGVSLNPQQKVAVGSVLDLFEGRPSLKHLSLWHPDGQFQDPIALAKGYDRFAAQWYGLPALFDPINIQSHKVIDGGNPIVFELSNKYVVKGINKEQIMNSIVRIHLGADGRIEKVEDRWNDKLPDGAISETFRKLNAATMPNLVKVPKTEEEDKKMQAERHGQQ